MAKIQRLDGNRAALIVIDVQEAFRSVVADYALIASRISTAVRGFTLLEVPVIVTEQYPKGLGSTAEEISYSMDEQIAVIEKMTFSACGSAEFMDALQATSAEQIVVCGIEAHVCVNQTVQDLIENGFEVHLLTDSVGSRFSHDKQAGIDRMLACGAIPSSVEMALFEMMADSKHASFKAVQDLIK